MPDIVVLGDTNVDIIAHFPFYPAKGQDALASATGFHCGGSAANAAMALARMGLEVSLISRVGTDPLSVEVLDGLSEAGVLRSDIQQDPEAVTGLMYVIVTPDGERTILGYRGANVFTNPNQIREQQIREAKLLHLSGYAFLADPQRSAALLALEMACRHGLTVTLDPGMSVPQAALDEMRALLPAIDVLLPSLAEAQRLTGLVKPELCAQSLLDAGVTVVALKLGGEGCLIGSSLGLSRVPGFSVHARDTTGAGDYFAAGLIAAFLGGLDWLDAAVLANAMGAVAVARVGAGTSVPKAGEVLDLLRVHRQASDHAPWADAIQRVSAFVSSLAAESKEEGKRWWK